MYIQLNFSLPAMGWGWGAGRWNHHRNKCTVLSAGPLTVTQVVCLIHTCTMGSKNLQTVFCGSRISGYIAVMSAFKAVTKRQVST